MNKPKEHGRILLIYPPYNRLYDSMFCGSMYPLSLGYLAGSIKKETNWEVMIYNADFVPSSRNHSSRALTYLCGEGFGNYVRNLTDLSYSVWEEVRSCIRSYKPSIVGIYCSAANLGCVTVVARLAKECDRHILVVVGGPHPTTVGMEMLDDSNIDVSVRGEGERTIVDILDAVENKQSLSDIKGIVYRDGMKSVETPRRECVNDLDSLCFPYHYAPEVLKDYHEYPKSAFHYVMATRGCFSNCVFCGSKYVFGKKVRQRSVKNILEELESLTRMGIKWIEFRDDTFGSDKEYTRQLCECLQRNFRGLRWGCQTRSDVIDDQTVALFKRAGCRQIALGIESGNNEILRRMRKGTTIESALNASKIIRKHGIHLIAFFMIGFPGETERTLRDTFDAMNRIDGTLVYNIFTPYPGTEAFDLCKQTGVININYNPALYNHQSPMNNFCWSIHKERFRELASEIEEYVDRHNRRQFFRNIFSYDSFQGVHDYGFLEASKRFSNILRSLL